MKPLSRIFSKLAGRHSVCDYYTSLDELPLYNWFKIMDTDDLRYLYFEPEKHKEVPAKFGDLFVEMVFQMENMDTTEIKIMAKAAFYRSKAVTNNDSRAAYEAILLEKELSELRVKRRMQKKMSLPAFISYIEVTLKLGYPIDAKKTSTQKAYSLFHEAQKINEARIKEMERA